MDGLVLDHVQIAIPAGGEDEARQFFGELLGLTEIPKPHEMAGRGGCWFQLGIRVAPSLLPSYRTPYGSATPGKS